MISNFVGMFFGVISMFFAMSRLQHWTNLATELGEDPKVRNERETLLTKQTLAEIKNKGAEVKIRGSNLFNTTRTL